MVWGFILLLRLKNKNKVFKKSGYYFLTFMKDAKISFQTFRKCVSLRKLNS